jgi:hypothetical protein
VLRHLARQAGVHLYVETGEQVLCEKGYLALHAGFDGERTVRLPGLSDVENADTGESVGRDIREFSASLRRGDTAIWRLGRDAPPGRRPDQCPAEPAESREGL